MSGEVERQRTVALVVDDDPALREVISALLEDEGYEVVAAADAVDALRILKEDSPSLSLIVSDVQMPGLIDGIALTEIVALSWPKISILVSSGKPELCKGDLPAKAALLPKPWRAVQLLDAVACLKADTAIV